MKRVVLVIAIIVGIVLLASLVLSFRIFRGRCGDGICQPNELRRGSCVRDCAQNTTSYGAGDYTFILMHQGMERRYFVHVPSSYKAQNSVSLIINLHGGGGSPQNEMEQSGMNSKSDSVGFIVVYPEGTGRSIGNRVFATWNAGRCCGFAQENEIDDVGFISKMIDDLEIKFNIDPKRVYATGLSNGALMSYQLACSLSDKIAAIAPVSAQDSVISCSPTRAVPVLHFHGTADPAAPYDGGHCGGRLPGDPGWDCKSVPEYLDEWRVRNKCSSETEEYYKKGTASCERFTECADNADVILCTIEGAGHTWPDGSYSALGENAVGKISRDISANDVMWEFFKAHPMH